MTAKELYKNIKTELQETLSENSNEARILFKEICGFDPVAFLEKTVSHDNKTKLELAVQRRKSGYPLQYIIGCWDFFDFELLVGEGVLIPRPDTEAIAQKAIDLLQQTDRKKALDLCSGSGCIAIAIKRAVLNSDVTAVELDKAAFSYLEKNVRNLASDVTCVNADALLYCNEIYDETFDVVVSNPPYVSKSEYQSLAKELYFEPKQALVAQNDGYFFYEKFSKLYYDKIKKGGYLVFEIGDRQLGQVSKLLRQNGFCDVEQIEDCFKNVRGVFGRKT